MRENLVLAWILIVLGVLFGLGIGTLFHREEWWGGYGSYRRRLYRLAHVSFFGLAILNLLFYFTVNGSAATSGLRVAAIGFIAGGLTMPPCALVVAHSPRFRWLFAVPVLALLLGSVLTLWKVWAS